MPRKTTKPRSRNRWEDHYTRKARQDNYPARSVYKLKEIQKRYRLLHPGNRVLDLGCAPGSWLKLAAEVVGPRGYVLGLDLKPVEVALPSHAHAVVADIFDLKDDTIALLSRGFHCVISDMAPATTGHKDVDAARSFNLCESALGIAKDHLLDGGRFVCKIFQGPDSQAFIATIKHTFTRCHIYKPQSSRKASREIFVIGKGKKQEV
jgi:23S rRNA (uridine2552-2'-O)-methyltransferase